MNFFDFVNMNGFVWVIFVLDECKSFGFVG